LKKKPGAPWEMNAGVAAKSRIGLVGCMISDPDAGLNSRKLLAGMPAVTAAQAMIKKQEEDGMTPWEPIRGAAWSGKKKKQEGGEQEGGRKKRAKKPAK